VEVLSMNEIFVTVTGNVGSPPRSAVTKGGHPVSSFRLGSTPRRYDRAQGGWVDGPTSWFTVSCWRQLADHVTSCIGMGNPVVVHGKLRVREFTRGDGTPATSLEIEATSVGIDLNRGTAFFKRDDRPRETSEAAEPDTTVDDLVRLVTEEAEGITAAATPEGTSAGGTRPEGSVAA
jgi:single-strand DNA-binding protein